MRVLNWYDLALKLHLSELPDSCQHDAPVVENILKCLIQESSIRTRRSQEVITRGLATVPKVFKTMPLIEQSKELLMKTVRPSKDGEDMPMHYPGLNHHNKAPFKSDLEIDTIFNPVQKIEQIEISSGTVVKLFDSVGDASRATG